MSKSGSYTCQNCGKDFKGWSGNANKFCSRKCKNESQKKKYGDISCTECGKELTHNQKKRYTINKRYYKNKGENYGDPFCSQRCAKKNKRVPKVKRTCKRCGKDFMERKWQVENHNRGHYCSKECSTKQQAENRSKKARTETECQQCNKTFSALKNYLDQGLRKYCSRKCKDLAQRNRVECKCANCGKNFDRVVSQTSKYRKGKIRADFCSTECLNRYTKEKVKKGVPVYGSQKKRDRDSILTPKEYQSVARKLKDRQYIRNLEDPYIRGELSKRLSIPSKEIPKELIELKRLNIKRKRKIKEITHGNSQ